MFDAFAAIRANKVVNDRVYSIPAPLAAESAEYPEIKFAIQATAKDAKLFGRNFVLMKTAHDFLIHILAHKAFSLLAPVGRSEIRMARSEINFATRELFKELGLRSDFSLIKQDQNNLVISDSSLLDLNRQLLKNLKKAAYIAAASAKRQNDASAVATAIAAPRVETSSAVPAPPPNITSVETYPELPLTTLEKNKGTAPDLILAAEKNIEAAVVDSTDALDQTADVETSASVPTHLEDIAQVELNPESAVITQNEEEAIAPDLTVGAEDTVESSPDSSENTREHFSAAAMAIAAPQELTSPVVTIPLTNNSPVEASAYLAPTVGGAVTKGSASKRKPQKKAETSTVARPKTAHFVEFNNEIKRKANMNIDCISTAQKAFALLLRNTASQYKVEGIGPLSSLDAFHTFVGSKLERHIGNIDTRLSVTQSITRLYDGSEPPLDPSGNLTPAAHFAISFLRIKDVDISDVVPELAPAVEARRAKFVALRKEKEATL